MAFTAAPEGASAIVHRNTDYAPSMAEAQGVTVASLHAHGLVEHIVDERPDASLEPKAFCTRMGQAIEYELAALANAGINRMLPERLAKYRKLGGMQPMLPQC